MACASTTPLSTPETISAARRPNGGKPAASRSASSNGDETVPVTGGDRLHHRVIGGPGLDERAAAVVRAVRRVQTLG